MKIEIELTGGSIALDIENGAGSITSTFHDDMREAEALGPEQGENEANAWMKYEAALDGIEALVLAHACAGVDVKDPKYVEGIESAIHGAANNI